MLYVVKCFMKPLSARRVGLMNNETENNLSEHYPAKENSETPFHRERLVIEP